MNLDHDANNRRATTHQLKGEALREKAFNDWKRIINLEQQRYAGFALSHRHEDSFCRSVTLQVESGRTVSKKQVQRLMQIAAERGWAVGTKAAKKATTSAARTAAAARYAGSCMKCKGDYPAGTVIGYDDFHKWVHADCGQPELRANGNDKHWAWSQPAEQDTHP